MVFTIIYSFQISKNICFHYVMFFSIDFLFFILCYSDYSSISLIKRERRIWFSRLFLILNYDFHHVLLKNTYGNNFKIVICSKLKGSSYKHQTPSYLGVECYPIRNRIYCLTLYVLN